MVDSLKSLVSKTGNQIKQHTYDLISGASTTDEDMVLNGDDKSGMLNKLIHYALWGMILTFDIIVCISFSADKAGFENVHGKTYQAVHLESIPAAAAEGAADAAADAKFKLFSEGRESEYSYLMWLIWVQAVVCFVCALGGMLIIGMFRIPVKPSWPYAVILGGLLFSNGAACLALIGFGRHPSAVELYSFVFLLLSVFVKTLGITTVVRNDMLAQNYHTVELLKASKSHDSKGFGA